VKLYNLLVCNRPARLENLAECRLRRVDWLARVCLDWTRGDKWREEAKSGRDSFDLCVFARLHRAKCWRQVHTVSGALVFRPAECLVFTLARRFSHFQAERPPEGQHSSLEVELHRMHNKCRLARPETEPGRS